MAREFIITLTAENRLGILAAVTKAMGELDAELREASQTIVCGYFTMIFAAEFPDECQEQVVRDHLVDICRPFGIEVVMKPLREVTPAHGPGQTVARKMHITGQNAPGMLRRIAVSLSMNQVDVIGLHAWRDEAPNRFDMVMKISAPETADLESLPAEIESIEPAWELKVAIE